MSARVDLPVLLPYQQQWFSDRSTVKVCTKSRQIGISWATACEAVIVAGSNVGHGGMDVWYLCQGKEDAKEFVRDAATFARGFESGFESVGDEEMVLEDGEKSILVTVIHFASGFRITILPGNRPSVLRGKKGYVIFDEAALLKLAECRAAADAFSMWGGRVAFISTQSTEESAWNKWLEEIERGESKASKHMITIHDAVRDGLYRRICKVKRQKWTAAKEVAWVEDLLTSPSAAQEFLCIPGRQEGGYMSRELVEARMYDAPILRFSLPAGWELEGTEEERVAFVDDWIENTLGPHLKALNPHRQHALGQDFGRSPTGDLSVLAPLSIEQNLQRRCPFLIELRGIPFEQQKQIHFAVGHGLPKLLAIRIDQGGNGAYLAEKSQQEFGEHIVEKVSCGRPWYAEHVPRYKDALEAIRILIPRDADVLNDHSAFQVIDSIPLLPKKREKGTDGEQRHGDAAVALVLGWQASSLPESKIERTAPKKDGLWARNSGRRGGRERRKW